MSHAKDNTKAVYANYRNALKAQNRTAESRAGARKQNALKVSADRYKMPISEVKAIVRTYEAAAGITHEHTVDYLREVAFAELAAKAEAELIPKQIEDHDEVYCSKCYTKDADAVISVRPNMKELAERNHLSFSVQCFTCWYNSIDKTEPYVSSSASFATVLRNWSPENQ